MSPSRSGRTPINRKSEVGDDNWAVTLERCDTCHDADRTLVLDRMEPRRRLADVR